MQYLYRDEGNYKNWGEIVLSNPSNLPLQRIEQMLSDALFEGLYFVADSAGLPDLHFTEGSTALDHDWHELHGLAETKDPVSDTGDRCVEQPIGCLQSQFVCRV
jgi:hypothetical protein